MFALVNAEESTAPAWHTARALAESFRRSLQRDLAGSDRRHLELRFDGWRNSWQQWVLKKNMMR